MGEKINLGSKVQDQITHAVGVATARCEYLHDTTSILVEQKIADDGSTRSFWVAEERLAVID